MMITFPSEITGRPVAWSSVTLPIVARVWSGPASRLLNRDGSGIMKQENAIAGQAQPSNRQPPRARATSAAASGIVAASSHWSFRSNSQARVTRSATSGMTPHHRGENVRASSRPRRRQRMMAQTGRTKNPCE